MNPVLNRFNKLRVIYNIIGKDLNRYYDIMMEESRSTNDDITINLIDSSNTLIALTSAKEKIIELENEINNATPKTEDA